MDGNRKQPPLPSIQIPPFLAIALGGNPFLHTFIEQAYRKNEWAFYEAYQKSEFKGNPLFAMYSTKSEEKIRQVAGIMEWCYQNKNLTLLDQLIKKGYKFVYHYVKTQAQIDFEHFVRSYAKKHKGKQITEKELFYQNIILWYLSVREHKPFITDNVTWVSFQDILKAALNEENLEEVNFSEYAFNKHHEEMESLYVEYNIPKNPHFNSLGVFLEYLISNSFKNIYEKTPNCDIDTAQKQVFQVAPTNHIGALGGWLKTLKINELDAAEQVPFSKKDLDMVFLSLLLAKEHNSVSKEEQDLFIISCLYIKCLGFLYHEAKQLYLDQSKQDYYVEMKAKEERILKHETELVQKQTGWEKSVYKKQREIEGLTKELREAQAKIRQLEQQLENREDYSKEVHALRSFAYQEEQVINDSDMSPSLSSMTALIQSKRIVIFGGHPNWQQRLKEVLPSVEFIEVDEKNRDISKIQRFDAVFINTSVFAHSFYQRIMNELSKFEIPLYYINGQRNIERNIAEIYKRLT